MQHSHFDPFKLMASNLALWADASRTIHSQYVTALARAIESMPGTLEWTDAGTPILKPATGRSEEQMRETFQTAANINVSTWTHAASILAAMPEWTQTPTKFTGRAITDMFDEMRRSKR